MVSIIKTGSSPEIGRAILATEELAKVFSFCKKLDIVDGDIKPDSPFIFDVRPEAIHLLSKENKEIMTSIYVDREKGKMSIELGDEPSLDADKAVQKWAEVITNALR